MDRITNEDIKVLGRVVNISTENVVADAEQIYDSNWSHPDYTGNKSQSKINDFMKIKISLLDGFKFHVGTNPQAADADFLYIDHPRLLVDSLAVGNGIISGGGITVNHGQSDFRGLVKIFNGLDATNAKLTGNVEIEPRSELLVSGHQHITGDLVVDGNFVCPSFVVDPDTITIDADTIRKASTVAYGVTRLLDMNSDNKLQTDVLTWKDFNSFIQETAQHFDALESHIGEISEDVANNTERIAENKAAITALNQDIISIGDSVSNLSVEVNELSDVYGDINNHIQDIMDELMSLSNRVTALEGSKIYSVFGNIPGHYFTDVDMVRKFGYNSYEAQFENIPSGEYKFAVRVNHSNDEAYPGTTLDDMYIFTVAEDNSKVIISFTPGSNTISVTIESPTVDYDTEIKTKVSNALAQQGHTSSIENMIYSYVKVPNTDAYAISVWDAGIRKFVLLRLPEKYDSNGGVIRPAGVIGISSENCTDRLNIANTFTNNSYNTLTGTTISGNYMKGDVVATTTLSDDEFNSLNDKLFMIQDKTLRYCSIIAGEKKFETKYGYKTQLTLANYWGGSTTEYGNSGRVAAAVFEGPQGRTYGAFLVTSTTRDEAIMIKTVSPTSNTINYVGLEDLSSISDILTEDSISPTVDYRLDNLGISYIRSIGGGHPYSDLEGDECFA